MKLNKSQCLYVMHNPELNITKIGITENLNTRKSTLETACGCRLTLVYNSIYILDARLYEIRVHHKLSHKRKLGEWFYTTPEDAIKIIESVIVGATEDPIVVAYRNGNSISKIAEHNNVSRQAIIHRLTDYGIKANPKQPPEEIIAVVETYKGIKEVPPTVFLDDTKPDFPVKNLKRAEPNINFNGEWFQVSTYKNGNFSYAYTKDIQKAREYLKSLK